VKGTIATWVVIGILALWYIGLQVLDWIGRLQTAKDIFEHRGKIRSAIGRFLTWRWSPAVTFLALVIVFAAIQIIPSVLAYLARTEAKTPNIHQTVSSPGGPTYQVGEVHGNLTINEGGVSEEDRKMLHHLVRKKALDGMAEFAQKYRHGYLIFGLAPDGRPITYQGDLRDVVIKVDWSKLKVARTDSDRLLISTPRIYMRYENGDEFLFHDDVVDQPFVENEPLHSPYEDIGFELLDGKKGIFLIGFK